MKVRLISGRFGGRIMNGSDTATTHPMGERIRNAMFNTIGRNIAGAEVLDAFAGSGSVGLEALSRGASQVTFVERDRAAQKVISANMKLLGCESEVKLVRASVDVWSERNPEVLFDFIFADPPYDDMQFSTVERLFTHLKPGATMILSHPGKGEVPSGTREFVVVDNRSYGNASLTFFYREP